MYIYLYIYIYILSICKLFSSLSAPTDVCKSFKSTHLPLPYTSYKNYSYSSMVSIFSTKMPYKCAWNL